MQNIRQVEKDGWLQKVYRLKFIFLIKCCYSTNDKKL
jgi:hypothetical protein